MSIKKSWERILTERLTNVVLTENQVDIAAGKGATDGIHIIRLVMKKSPDNKNSRMDTLRTQGVPEYYVRLVIDTH